MTVQFRTRIPSVIDYSTEIKSSGVCCYMNNGSSKKVQTTQIECHALNGHFQFGNIDEISCVEPTELGCCCSCAIAEEQNNPEAYEAFLDAVLPSEIHCSTGPASRREWGDGIGLKSNITKCQCDKYGGKWTIGECPTVFEDDVFGIDGVRTRCYKPIETIPPVELKYYCTPTGLCATCISYDCPSDVQLYDNQEDCNDACPDPPRFRCVYGNCCSVDDPKAPYETLQACQEECPRYKCNTTTGNCDAIFNDASGALGSVGTSGECEDVCEQIGACCTSSGPGNPNPTAGCNRCRQSTKESCPDTITSDGCQQSWINPNSLALSPKSCTDIFKNNQSAPCITTPDGTCCGWLENPLSCELVREWDCYENGKGQPRWFSGYGSDACEGCQNAVQKYSCVNGTCVGSYRPGHPQYDTLDECNNAQQCPRWILDDVAGGCIAIYHNNNQWETAYRTEALCMSPCNIVDPTGSCCYSNGICTTTTEGGCSDGIWTYSLTPCIPNNCAEAEGTCCYIEASGDRICTIGVTQAQCSAIAHEDPNFIFTFNNNSCADCLPFTGRCCISGNCTSNTTRVNCLGSNGTWSKNGLCTPEICEECTGSCCYTDGTCADTAHTECPVGVGTFSAGTNCNDTTCGEAPPDPTGSCCFYYDTSSRYCGNSVTNEFCTSEAERLNATSDAVFTSGGVCNPNTACGTDPNPLGSCCYSNGNCSLKFESECTEITEIFTPGGSCNPNICTQPVQKCCFSDDTPCRDLSNDDCSNEGGISSIGSCISGGCDSENIVNCCNQCTNEFKTLGACTSSNGIVVENENVDCCVYCCTNQNTNNPECNLVVSGNNLLATERCINEFAGVPSNTINCDSNCTSWKWQCLGGNCVRTAEGTHDTQVICENLCFTGACCHSDGSCEDNVLQGECLAPATSFNKNKLCGEVFCVDAPPEECQVPTEDNFCVCCAAAGPLSTLLCVPIRCTVCITGDDPLNGPQCIQDAIKAGTISDCAATWAFNEGSGACPTGSAPSSLLTSPTPLPGEYSSTANSQSTCEIDVRIPRACCFVQYDPTFGAIGMTCHNVCSSAKCEKLKMVSDSQHPAVYVEQAICPPRILVTGAAYSCDYVIPHAITQRSTSTAIQFGTCWELGAGTTYACDIKDESSCRRSNGYWVSLDTSEGMMCNSDYMPQEIQLSTTRLVEPETMAESDFETLGLEFGDFYKGGYYIGVYSPGRKAIDDASLLFGSLSFTMPNIFKSSDHGKGEGTNKKWVLLAEPNTYTTSFLNNIEEEIVLPYNKLSKYDGFYNCYGNGSSFAGVRSSLTNAVIGRNTRGFVDYYLPSIYELMFLAHQIYDFTTDNYVKYISIFKNDLGIEAPTYLSSTGLTDRLLYSQYLQPDDVHSFGRVFASKLKSVNSIKFFRRIVLT